MAGNPIDLIQEEALFKRLKSDPQAVTEVYERYANALYAFLLKRCRQKEIAEDLVAQCFVKLLESAPGLEWKGVSIGAWLYRVATNALADHWRSAHTRKSQPLDTETWDPPSADDPVWNTQISMEGERIQKALDQLTERDQQVLTLRFYGGYETEDVAKTLDISNNHAAVLTYRALGRMRKNLISTDL